LFIDHIKNKKVDYEGKPFVTNFIVPFSAVINGIAKKRKIKTRVKGKITEVVKTIHLNRLSKIIEAVTAEEKDYLESKCGPWDILAKLHKDYAKGVSLDKVDLVREQYKNSYSKQFEVTSKLSGWRAERRRFMDEFSASISKNHVFKTNDNEEFLFFMSTGWKDKNFGQKLKVMSFGYLRQCMGDTTDAKYKLASTNLLKNDVVFKLIRNNQDLDTFRECYYWAPLDSEYMTTVYDKIEELYKGGVLKFDSEDSGPG
jgi:hypothetical protein